jgi:hypothetical protein
MTSTTDKNKKKFANEREMSFLSLSYFYYILSFKLKFIRKIIGKKVIRFWGAKNLIIPIS